MIIELYYKSEGVIMEKKRKYQKPKLNIHGDLIKLTKAKMGPGEDALSKLSR
jgi:hypothetical protein